MTEFCTPSEYAKLYRRSTSGNSTRSSSDTGKRGDLILPNSMDEVVVIEEETKIKIGTIMDARRQDCCDIRPRGSLEGWVRQRRAATARICRDNRLHARSQYSVFSIDGRLTEPKGHRATEDDRKRIVAEHIIDLFTGDPQ